MKRLAKPAEIADAAILLASDRSSFVTGQVLSVSGGLTMVDSVRRGASTKHPLFASDMRGLSQSAHARTVKMAKVTSLATAISATVSPGASHSLRVHAQPFACGGVRSCTPVPRSPVLDHRRSLGDQYASILVRGGRRRATEDPIRRRHLSGAGPLASASRSRSPEASTTIPIGPTLTMTLRLMAGAMGWPSSQRIAFLARVSGTIGRRATIVDPFSGHETAVIQSLRPDVAFLHVAGR